MWLVGFHVGGFDDFGPLIDFGTDEAAPFFRAVADRFRALARQAIDDFGRALSGADALLVTEVYAAGEEPIANADGRAICRAVSGRGQIEPVFVEQVSELAGTLAGLIKDGDVILTMGAGSIGGVAHELPQALAAGARS